VLQVLLHACEQLVLRLRSLARRSARIAEALRLRLFALLQLGYARTRRGFVGSRRLGLLFKLAELGALRVVLRLDVAALLLRGVVHFERFRDDGSVGLDARLCGSALLLTRFGALQNCREALLLLRGVAARELAKRLLRALAKVNLCLVVVWCCVCVVCWV
jgi:hypothetical protein